MTWLSLVYVAGLGGREDIIKSFCKEVFTPMSAEYNSTIVRSFYEDGFNKGDFDSVRPYIAPSFVSHNPIIGSLSPGYEGYKQLVAIHRKAFPDIRVKIEEMIVNVDRVVVRWTWRGTHQGHFPTQF